MIDDNDINLEPDTPDDNKNEKPDIEDLEKSFNQSDDDQEDLNIELPSSDDLNTDLNEDSGLEEIISDPIENFELPGNEEDLSFEPEETETLDDPASQEGSGIEEQIGSDDLDLSNDTEETSDTEESSSMESMALEIGGDDLGGESLPEVPEEDTGIEETGLETGGIDLGIEDSLPETPEEDTGIEETGLETGGIDMGIGDSSPEAQEEDADIEESIQEALKEDLDIGESAVEAPGEEDDLTESLASTELEDTDIKDISQELSSVLDDLEELGDLDGDDVSQETAEDSSIPEPSGGVIDDINDIQQTLEESLDADTGIEDNILEEGLQDTESGQTPLEKGAAEEIAEEAVKETVEKKKSKAPMIFVVLLILAGAGYYFGIHSKAEKKSAPVRKTKPAAARRKKPASANPYVYPGVEIFQKDKNEGITTYVYSSDTGLNAIYRFYLSKMAKMNYTLKSDNFRAGKKYVHLIYSKGTKNCAIVINQRNNKVDTVVSYVE
ncbi:hypothetical protein ACFLUV_06125 [Elusimicrobiota bacterium]